MRLGGWYHRFRTDKALLLYQDILAIESVFNTNEAKTQKMKDMAFLILAMRTKNLDKRADILKHLCQARGKKQFNRKDRRKQKSGAV